MSHELFSLNFKQLMTVEIYVKNPRVYLGLDEFDGVSDGDKELEKLASLRERRKLVLPDPNNIVGHEELINWLTEAEFSTIDELNKVSHSENDRYINQILWLRYLSVKGKQDQYDVKIVDTFGITFPKANETNYTFELLLQEIARLRLKEDKELYTLLYEYSTKTFQSIPILSSLIDILLRGENNTNELIRTFKVYESIITEYEQVHGLNSSPYVVLFLEKLASLTSRLIKEEGSHELILNFIKTLKLKFEDFTEKFQVPFKFYALDSIHIDPIFCDPVFVSRISPVISSLIQSCEYLCQNSLDAPDLKKNLEQSVKFHHFFIQLNPKLPVSLGLVKTLVKLNQIQSATKIMKKTLQTDATNFKYINFMIVLLVASREYSTATKLINSTLLYIEQDSELSKAENDDIINLKILEILVIEKIHSPQVALNYLNDLFETYHKFYGQPGNASPLLDKIWLLASVLYENNKLYDEASNCLNEMAKPDLSRKAWLNIAQNKYQEAHDQIESVLTPIPSSFSPQARFSAILGLSHLAYNHPETFKSQKDIKSVQARCHTNLQRLRSDYTFSNHHHVYHFLSLSYEKLGDQVSLQEVLSYTVNLPDIILDLDEL
ncbi:Hypothetical protein PAS_chr3_0536 [Komagataella phaffii GS115]|uniref:Cargo-transport protein YPP1 n=2 Tax=Komagataella phaffii TaxID=460519 RepID=C4R4V0_KOMPG|nr:Hypothetical protein PAS_chr3_0536 [Komagataella phaffii GS115]AOA63864.1 GQ67_03610T0 [Komagataella phaffii]AOA68488.1 GQ68_03581T0 [Komagataella phaffii GS115]CAY70586.1 Hypothetical protein PAS_chr3_0536 [Komagataella phaffii GS115]